MAGLQGHRDRAGPRERRRNGVTHLVPVLVPEHESPELRRDRDRVMRDIGEPHTHVRETSGLQRAMGERRRAPQLPVERHRPHLQRGHRGVSTDEILVAEVRLDGAEPHGSSIAHVGVVRSDHLDRHRGPTTDIQGHPIRAGHHLGGHLDRAMVVVPNHEAIAVSRSAEVERVVAGTDVAEGDGEPGGPARTHGAGNDLAGIGFRCDDVLAMEATTGACDRQVGHALRCR